MLINELEFYNPSAVDHTLHLCSFHSYYDLLLTWYWLLERPRILTRNFTHGALISTDFGFTSEAKSEEAKISLGGRGTGGYRAPELLKEESEFTMKVDIWVLGCILYELVISKPAFASDFIVHR